MISSNGPTSTFDFAGLGSLKADAAKDPTNDVAIKKSAQQFEALFLQMMLKSMRDATPKGGLFDSEATKTFEQMYDQQIVMAMSERGSTGLAQMIEEFIRRSQTAVVPEAGEKFLLDGAQQDGLPLVNGSDEFRLPEGATQQFLLNRSRALLPGGDV
jgi:peptidoglycan hydrolase FlgJ